MSQDTIAPAQRLMQVKNQIAKVTKAFNVLYSEESLLLTKLHAIQTFLQIKVCVSVSLMFWALIVEIATWLHLGANETLIGHCICSN